MKRLSVFFFIILRELNRLFHQAVECCDVLVAQLKHEFEKVFSCLVLTRHDAVNAFDEIVVRIKASNYDPAQITIACEADCSSGVAAIVKGAGYRLGNEKMKNVSIYLYTGNMRAGLKAAGFEVLTDSKYLTSDAYLLEGDILLNDNAHVATNLTDGAKSSGTGASNTTTVKSNAKVDVAHGFNKSLAGTYKVTASGLNLRAGAGTGKSILAVMKNGEKVQCYGYYNDCNGVKWLYVVYKNIVGYASSKYLSK